MTSPKRQGAMSLRLSKEEMDMVRRLSDAIGVSQSDVLRMALREKWAERFGDQPPPGPNIKSKR